MSVITSITLESGYLLIAVDGAKPVKYPIADIIRAADVPSLAASKITSGTFAAERLGTDAVETAKIKDNAVTADKILDAAVTIGKIDSTLLGYLLDVGRIDYSGIDYCKIG